MHIVINANQRNVILDKKKKVWSDIKGWFLHKQPFEKLY